MEKEDLLQALLKFKAGNFSKARLDESLPGIDGEIARVFNEIAGASEQLVKDFETVSTHEENLSVIKHETGPYARCIQSFNDVILDVVIPTTEVVRIIEGIFIYIS